MNDKRLTAIDAVSSLKPRYLGQMHQLTALADKLWENAQALEGTPAQAYLKSRGINFSPAELRYLSSCPISGDAESGAHPAMLAALRDNDGLVAVEQIFLTFDGRLADIERPKRLLGVPVGGLGRWGMVPQQTLRLAETVEEAASAMVVGSQGIPVWPVFGCARYELIDIPASIRHIIIYARHSTEAANAIVRATPHLTEGGRSIEIKYPPGDESWNAYLARVRS